jgi:hypothetical protein
VNYTYTATSPDWTVIEGPTIGRIERKFTADGKLGGWVTPDGLKVPNAPKMYKYISNPC